MTVTVEAGTIVPGLRLDETGFGGVDIDDAFAALRRGAPVSWYQPGEFWAVVCHKDVRAISQQPLIFSSARGVMMGDQLDQTRLQRGGGAPEGSEQLLETDPPRHRKLRRLVGSFFTPRAVATLEDRVRDLVAGVLDSLDSGRPVDLVDQAAAPVPIMVIADVLGVPRQDWQMFKAWTDSMVVLLHPDVTPEKAAEAGAGVEELNRYLADLLGQRAESAEADLISELQRCTVEGERLSPLSVHTMCVAFLIAGNETTRSLIAGAAAALAQHPAHRRLLAERPELISVAVEEFLRWVSPVTSFLRTATQDTVVGQQKIQAGDCLAMFYRSANRDEDVWHDASTFDPLRSSKDGHLAFGWGEHLCIGAHLARLEVRVFFEELLKRYPDYAIAGEVKSTLSPLINITNELPVVLG